MLNISTYIEKKAIDSFYFSQDNIEDYFISLKDSSSIQVANSQLSKHKGHKLDGVVIIKSSDTTITNFMDWDDVDLMWIGVLEMALKYRKTGFGEHMMAMNGHEWSVKRIITKPENKILFRVRRNPLIFEGTDLYEDYKETKNIAVEKEFLSELLKAANEFIVFREKLFKIDCVGRLKAVMSEIQSC